MLMNTIETKFNILYCVLIANIRRKQNVAFFDDSRGFL